MKAFKTVTLTPKKDTQTVTPTGELIAPRIDGVVIRMATTIPDERGEICEIYSPAWGIHDESLVYVYQTSLRPHKVRGWVVHRIQDDRLFVSMGSMQIVLYDDRRESPTYGMINEIYLGERNRGLLTIPHNVYHAVHNIGETEALFVNMPTRPYNHADPDKYRLPLDTDLIPYKFPVNAGW